MRASIVLAALLLAPTGAALAANEWGIEHEVKARFQGKVVDILCELSGDCPADCGAGKRQLGILKDDGTLVLAAKNNQPFAGAVNDLAGFCGERVEVDGLMINDPLVPLFALQFKRRLPDGEWSGGNQFGKDWLAANPDGDLKNWFREDPLIKRVIAEQGVFGIPELTPAE
ncbi:MAG: hypothetical protein ACFCUQ_04340 [Kiloniellales bacterium]